MSSGILLACFIFGIVASVPFLCDYPMVSKGEGIVETAIVVEFTYENQNLDGNGEPIQAKPKFYIPSKNTYVIKVANVEIGETYRIRYLPHTKICEILK